MSANAGIDEQATLGGVNGQCRHDDKARRAGPTVHETQHFADQNAYPEITPWEMEYRAKLTELALAREVSAIRLRGFITAQSDDPDADTPMPTSAWSPT